MISVLLADDQSLVRAGFRMILSAEDDIEVVGEASDGVEAVDAAIRLQPDAVLMDVRMPTLDGIEATRRVVAGAPSTKVLMLTTFDLNRYVYDSLRAGAAGFLLKDVQPEQLGAAVRTVAAGEMLLAPALTRRLIEQYVRRPMAGAGRPPRLGALTERELDVFRELARGRANVEIAAALHVSEGTVKTHVSKILGKLQLRDRVQAVIAAYECGLVEPGDPG